MSQYFGSEKYTQATETTTEPKNVIKASLFNLIVIADTLQNAIYAQELVQMITEKFPCKIIFIRTDPSIGEEMLQVSKSIVTIGSGSGAVCCDQITIETSKNQMHKAPFIMLPEIIQDLPTYLLTPQDPSQEKHVFPWIRRYADRIIYDGYAVQDIAGFASRIAEMQQRTKSLLVDISWAKTKGWRNILANVFKEEAKASLLEQVKIVHIFYAQNGADRGATSFAKQAFYLQAWFASRLKWQIEKVEKENSSIKLSYKSGENCVKVSLSPKDCEVVHQGAIFSIELTTYNDAHFLITHEHLNKHITVHASNRDCCEMPFSFFLPNYDRGRALVEELFYQPMSKHYKEILKMMQQPPFMNFSL